MRRFIILTSLFLFLLFGNFVNPTYANNTNEPIRNLSSTLLNQNLAALNFEAKESSALENPVIDPNFNVMRSKELNKSLAIPLVVGVIIIAIIAPVATWWFFSK